MNGSAANPKHDIIDTAMSEASFKIFLHALQSVSPLIDHLKSAGPFTVFMPTDQAFGALPPGTIEDLEKPFNSDRLTKLIKYHIVKGEHLSGEVKTMQTLETENGDRLAVLSDGNGLKINNAMVLGRDIVCTNGVIHAIDSVLLGF